MLIGFNGKLIDKPASVSTMDILGVFDWLPGSIISKSLNQHQGGTDGYLQNLGFEFAGSNWLKRLLILPNETL